MSRNPQMGTLKQEKLLTFTLGNERFCTAVGHVHEVMRPAEYTHLPGAWPGILGVINVRGKILPVVDASLSLTGTPTKDPSSGLVLILNSTHGEVGLLVDDVHGFIEHDTGCVSSPPDILPHLESVAGMIECAGTLLKLVDLLHLIERSIVNRSMVIAAAAS